MGNKLPEKARRGLTWRRLRNAIRAPLRLLDNIKFWYGDTVSESEHIFVIGPPRSGTTLLKTVLQSHSDICGVDGETWFFHRKDYAGFRHADIPDSDMWQLVQKAESVAGLFDHFAEAIKEKTGATYFLEKTPKHTLRPSYLVHHFPRSTFVFLVRDPRDGLRSAKGHPGYWSSLPHRDPTGGFLETWKRSVEAYEIHADVSSVILLRYEDFCHRPREEASRIMTTVGLEVEPKQLDPSTYGAEHDPKVGAHARLQEPITPESIGNWQETLSEAEVRRVERTLSQQMQTLGYSLEDETDG